MAKILDAVVAACLNCGYSAQIPAEQLLTRVDGDLSLRNVNTLFGRLKCSRCKSKQINLSDADGRLLLDAIGVVRCWSCNLPIILPRIQAMPNVRLCQECAEGGRELEIHTPYPTPPPKLSKCARCNRPTVVRENSKSGEYFIGCTMFPECRWTTQLPEERW